LPERYSIPESTADAIQRARRVIAVGTSVTRALEGCYATFGEVRAADAITDLRIDERTELHVVDALLTGMHEPGTSHYDLMQAFSGDRLLARADAHASALGYLGHEFGDATLIMRGALSRRRTIAA
jgi:S-adenosylmethionine:tRNA ribosyltransferase-isomerase